MEAVTEDEVLEELRKLFCGNEVGTEGYTCEELSEISGFSKHHVQRKLKPLIKAGRVRVTRVERDNIVGTRIKVPAYVVVSES